MQDWEVEIAKPQKLPEFISYFSNNSLSDGQRVSLAGIIFQSIEELLMERQTELANEYWNNVSPLIQEHKEVLKEVLDYWKNSGFYLSPLLMQVDQ
jgi:hypothetical protein